MSSHHTGIFRGALLIAGTTIGGGMLALPILTSLGGFLPSLVLYLFCWLFMSSTGLLFLEVCTWMKSESNIVTMADKTLGPVGKAAAWILYLFLFYCLTIAYIVGCGNLLVELTGLPQWAGALCIVLLFAPFIYKGARFVGKFNILMMLGLAVTYFAFIYFGYDHVRTELLMRRDWHLAYLALPIAFTAFAYQGIVPTLYHDMGNNVSNARWAILIGSFLPLIAYGVWQWLILGIIPVEGPNGLLEALNQGANAVSPLKQQLNIPKIYVIGQFFAFFALITSFFGVTLGLMDFLADGLKIAKDSLGKVKLCGLIFIPPLLVAMAYPHIFLKALDFAGGFGCALLLGVMPILMVWVGRYRMKMSAPQILPGGRLVLSALLLFVSIELIFEFMHHL